MEAQDTVKDTGIHSRQKYKKKKPALNLMEMVVPLAATILP